MTERKCLVFSFAEIEVREREFSIVRNDEVLAVEPKAFRVLLFLLRNPRKLITKDELLDAVWGDTAVSENSLTRSIALLRKLLGDDTHEPRYIATVPTVGYRFLCDVKAVEENHSHLESLNAVSAAERPPAVKAEQPPIEPPVRHTRAPLRFLAAALALVVIAAGFLVHHAFSSRNDSGRASAASVPRTVALTNLAGLISGPAFSPEGKQIAFIWDGENPGKGDVYVQLVGGDKPLRLTHTQSGFTCCVAWSPDGTQIAFGRCQDGAGGVYIVPGLGGPERKLSDVICPFGDAGQPQWTADGKSLILADSCVPNGPRGIVLFSLETGAKRCLHEPGPFSDAGDLHPALSPDHETVAFEETVNLEQNIEIDTVKLADDHFKQLTHDGPAYHIPLMWTPDGRHIVFGSNRSGALLRVSTVDGVIEPETAYPNIGSLSEHGRLLAYATQSGLPPTTWRADLARSGGKVVSLNKHLFLSNGDDSAQISPDGRQIVYRTFASGRYQNLWRNDAGGSNPVQLTFIDNNKGFNGSPRWSPDLKWVVFDYHVGQHSRIDMVDSEGRNQHTVASGDYENVVPNFSRDGKSIYFASNRTRDWQIWKRNLTSGQETRITRHGGFLAIESYDGKTLYYSKFEGGGLWSIPVSGGPEELVTPALHRGYWGHFAVTDSGIYLLDVDAMPRPTIMYYSIQTRKLMPVLQMEEQPFPWVANLSASRDGRILLFEQWAPQSQVVMVENLPQPSSRSDD